MLLLRMFVFVLVTEILDAIELNINEVKFGFCDRDDIAPDKEHDVGLLQFSTLNHGLWDIVITPKYQDFEEAEWAFVDFDLTDKKSIFLATVFIKFPNHAPRQYSRELLSDTSKGVIGIIRNFTLGGANVLTRARMTLLKIKPKHWAFFYMCRTDGTGEEAQSSIDLRYVIAQENLTSEDVQEIYKLDKKLKFKGDLISIPYNGKQNIHS